MILPCCKVCVHSLFADVNTIAVQETLSTPIILKQIITMDNINNKNIHTEYCLVFMIFLSTNIIIW